MLSPEVSRLRGWRLGAVGVLVGGAYFLLGKASLGLTFIHASASPVWPPTGFAVATLLLLGLRLWPAFFVGAFLFNLTTAGNAWTSLAIGAGNAMEALVGAWFSLRFCGGRAAFDRAADTLRFAILVGAAAPIVSATIGSLSLATAGFAQWERLPVIWTTWWLGNAGGALAVAPPLLLWSQRPWPKGREAREFVAALAVGTGLAVLAFDVLAPGPADPLWLLLVPLVVAWVIARLGAREAVTLLLAVDAVAVAATLRGRGPLWIEEPNDSLLLLQVFLLFATTVTLLLAAGRRARTEAAADGFAQHGWLPFLLPAAALTPLMFSVLVAGSLVSELPGTPGRVAPWAAVSTGGALSLALAGLVYATDATRRRAVELAQAMTRELRLSQEGLAEAQRLARVGSWEWDVRDDRIVWSDELYRLFGLTRELTPPGYEAFLQRLPPEDRSRLDAVVRESLRTARPFELEHRLERPDGEVRWVQARGSVEVDAAGRPVRMRGTSQDVTDRKREEQRLRAVLETAPDAMVVVDAQGRVRLLNTAAEALFGWRRDELIGQPIEVLVPAAQRTLHVKNREEYVRHPVSRPMGVGLDLHAVRRDGTSFPAEIALGPFETEEGLLVTAAVRDVTERRRVDQERFEARQKAAELERLRAQDEFKTRFINAAAHELNTPLTPIKLELHVLERALEQEAGAPQRAAVAIVRRNVERIESLVQDLLDSARVQAGRLGLTRVPLDLAAVAQESVDSYASTARAASVGLEDELESALVDADVRRVTQVAHNLLSNAIKFTPAGGRVMVSTGVREREAFLRVRDTGLGLTPEQMGRLFQPFVQVHDMPQIARPGTGLGLYICQNLAKLHEGRIDVESEGPGRGSTFTLWLPRRLTA